MKKNEKKALKYYFENRKEFKNEIIELISNLEDEDNPERESFKNFLKENIGKNNIVNTESSSMVMDILKELKYPDEIAEKFDELFLMVLDEEDYDIFEGEFDEDHILLYENNFSCLGTFSGNAYAFNFNKENPEIIYIDYSSTYTSESDLEELYSEYHDFWFNKETNSYSNKNKLLLNKIYKKNGKYKIKSEYIIDYLNTISGKGLSYHTFVNFITMKVDTKYTDLFK